MRIFVSSRMQELQTERKTAVDFIHLVGHDPVYIETEPIVKDEKAKKTMDLMIERSNALISICYISLGKIEKILNRRSPIDYEMARFREIHPDGKVVLLEKKADSHIIREPHLDDWINKQRENGIKIIPFSTTGELAERIVEHTEFLPKGEQMDESLRKAIRFEGPDYVGLIEVLSETLFSEFGANIDYISQGARAGLATVLLGCSFRDKAPASSSAIMERIESVVQEDMESEKETQETLPLKTEKYEIRVMVEDDEQSELESEYLIEIRAIDAPGQLNAVCKVLKKLRLNIDDVTLRPAPSEYPRQTVIVMWISSLGDSILDGTSSKPPSASISRFARLECEIHEIIGVRSFSIRKIKGSE